jgi:hypothetical protein
MQGKDIEELGAFLLAKRREGVLSNTELADLLTQLTNVLRTARDPRDVRPQIVRGIYDLKESLIAMHPELEPEVSNIGSTIRSR